LSWWNWMPLSDYKMGWVFPSLAAFIFMALIMRRKHPENKGWAGDHQKEI